MAYETRTYRVQFIAEIGLTCGTELGRWTDTLEAEIFDSKEAAEAHLVQHPDTIPEDRSWKHLPVRHKNSYHELRVRCSEKLIENALHSDEVSPAQQFDDSAVNRFALSMRLKLAQGRDKGRIGWHDPVLCSNEFLANMFLEHVTKSNSGNFVDLANICMMLHERGANPNSISEANEGRLVQVVQRNLHHVLGKALKDVKRDFPLDPPPEEEVAIYTGPINEGMAFIWEPNHPKARCQIQVMTVVEGSATMEGRILSCVPNSVVDPVWNDESRFREAVVPVTGEDVIRGRLLSVRIEALPISTRTKTCLAHAGIHTLGQLAEQSDVHLLRMPNLGRKSLNEIRAEVVPYSEKRRFKEFRK